MTNTQAKQVEKFNDILHHPIARVDLIQSVVTGGTLAIRAFSVDELQQLLDEERKMDGLVASELNDEAAKFRETVLRELAVIVWAKRSGLFL